MKAQIINFPKYPKHYHEFYYFREYFHVFCSAIVAWTMTVFVITYEHISFELGIGLGIWLFGIGLLVDFMVRLGLKRKKQEKQQRLHKLKKVDL